MFGQTFHFNTKMLIVLIQSNDKIEVLRHLLKFIYTSIVSRFPRSKKL